MEQPTPQPYHDAPAQEDSSNFAAIPRTQYRSSHHTHSGDQETAMVRVMSLHKMLPNVLTLMALTSGITSIQMAINGRYEEAVMLLLLAAVLDILDGAVARLLKASSEFGAELDSLSDFLGFGVAPALILYQFTLHDAGKLGWIATVALPVAAALRLARFNVMAQRDAHKIKSQQPQAETPLWRKRFFTGVPAPAGAGLALLPMFIWFQSPQTFDSLSFANPLIAFWLMFVGALMVSRLPTMSMKYLRVPARMTMPLLGGVALLLAALVHAPWTTLSLAAIGYLVSLPLGYRYFRKQEKTFESTSEDFSDLALGSIPVDDTNEPI